jgi:hypothetical protein
MGRIIHTTNAVATKIVALAVLLLIASAFASHAESAMVRNCTWCHGGSAQGYSPAPRLAGQRPTYIEQQLVSLHTTRATRHFRSNTCGALQGISVRGLHMPCRFTSLICRPGRPTTETANLWRGVRPSTAAGRKYCGLCRLPWPKCRRYWHDSSDRGA